MTTKKLIKHQVYWAKFLSKFNFIISSIMDKDNAKIDILIYYFNNYLANNYDDWQQYLLQTIFLSKKLKISFIDVKKTIQFLKK